MKYTKKPVTIDAVQLLATDKSILEVNKFIEGKDDIGHNVSVIASDKWEEYVYICLGQGGMYLKTMENKDGEQFASFGDYIIKGVKGEFYPCKPDIFEMTYSQGERYEEPNYSSVEQLTILQGELGYVQGEISTVAMLGLVGEAGEVLDEVNFNVKNSLISADLRDAINICGNLDRHKKALRKGTINLEIGLEKDQEISFDKELADTFYYLNILATNRGLTIFDLAQMAHDKVRAKQAEGGSSEDPKTT